MIVNDGNGFTDGRLLSVSYEEEATGQKRNRTSISPGTYDFGVAGDKVIFLVEAGEVTSESGDKLTAKTGEGLMFDPGQRVRFSCTEQSTFTYPFYRRQCA